MASGGRRRCGRELLSLAHAGHLSGLKVLFAKVVLQLLECAVPGVVLGGVVELGTAPGAAGLGWGRGVDVSGRLTAASGALWDKWG